jgi:hypothetical protein
MIKQEDDQQPRGLTMPGLALRGVQTAPTGGK